MSEFMKKTVMGYKAVQGGQSDPECTHVILRLDEYNDLLKKIRDAQNRESETKHRAENEIRNIKVRCANQLDYNKTEMEGKITLLRSEVEAQKQENGYQANLNVNLLRIARERANADRKLRPKKEHTGFVVISSKEKVHRYQTGTRKTESVICWETVLQSPYTVDFTEEQARRLIKDNLYPKDQEWLIGKIGISGKYMNGYSALVKDQDKSWIERNCVIEEQLRANYKAGYWEFILLHTKPLDVVPVDMRP